MLRDGADILDLAPVIPVVVVDSVEQAVPLARALVRGGIPVIEITLRSAAGLGAIEAVASEVEGMVVGAGTVVTPEQVQQVKDAGAQFIVTPGSPPRLLDAALASGLPLLAGAGHADRDADAGRGRARGDEVLPGRGEWGSSLPVGGGRSVPAAAVLPDRRHHAGDGCGLARAAQRRLRRWLLADAEGCCGTRRLGPHRGAGR